MLFRAFYTIVLLSLSSLYVQPAAEISHTGIAPDSAQSSEAAGKADPAFPEKRMYREISPGPESCTGVVICSQAAVLEGRLIPGQLGVVEGGNPTVLGKNMMEGMGLPRGTSWTQGGYRSHHLIPSEMAEHPVIQKIGMNMDHASNGVFLPQRGGTDVRLLSRHTGDHSIYNEAVRTMLDGMDVAAPAAKLEQQVFQLQQRLNTLTRNGLPMYIKEGGSLDLWLKYLRKP